MTGLGLTETGRKMRRPDLGKEKIRQESAGQDTEWAIRQMTGQDKEGGKETIGQGKAAKIRGGEDQKKKNQLR